MTKERQRRSASERSNIIERWQQSGLPAREFATQEGLNPSSLYLWRKQLTAATGGASQDGDRVPAFSELRLSGAQPAHGPIEVVARNGRIVRVHGEISAHALQRVLEAVERC
jgi:transposase-like protein